MAPKILTGFLMILLTSTGHARLITSAMGIVGDHVVTSREVRMNAAIESILFPTKNKKSTKRLDISADAFDKELKNVLLEWVVFLEAKSFSVAEIRKSELASAYGSINRALKGGRADFLKRLEPTRKELQDMIHRKLRSKEFIKFKSNASQAPITDAEALKYFQTNRGRYGRAPFTKYRSKIKALLRKRQANRRIQDWFRVLQKKHKVRTVQSQKLN